MNLKFLSILSLVIILFSCKKNQETNEIINTDNEEDIQQITEKEIAQLKYADYALDTKAIKEVVDWTEYHEIQNAIKDIKKGDLSYFNSNITVAKTLIKDLKQAIPSNINTSAILARIKTLETKLYKLHSLSNIATTSKQELINSIKEFFIAFSNLNLQINKKLEADNIIIEKP